MPAFLLDETRTESSDLTDQHPIPETNEQNFPFWTTNSNDQNAARDKELPRISCEDEAELIVDTRKYFQATGLVEITS